MRTGKILLLSGLLGFVALSGCGQHCGLTDASLLPHYDTTSLHQPGHPPDAPDGHPVEAVSIPAVTTVLNPEASKREISLQECIALALEKGRVGGTSIRVLAYDPAIAYTAIEEGLSRFDARLLTSMGWSQVDEPAGNVLDTIPLG
ncbi:MAG TPA: hypothetical protein VEL76_28625, partial [Gemmataceae bacterium]|nr:hypothetical protein [Gemmataceae bacterium]